MVAALAELPIPTSIKIEIIIVDVNIERLRKRLRERCGKNIGPHFGSQPFSREMLSFADPHRCGGAVYRLRSGVQTWTRDATEQRSETNREKDVIRLVDEIIRNDYEREE